MKNSARSIRLMLAAMGLAPLLAALSDAAPASTEALATPRTLDVDGQTHRFNLFAAPGAQRAPLVITLRGHGHGQSAKQMEAMTGWNAVAAERGAVVAYPLSRGAQWRIFGADSPDVDFLLALIDHLASEGLVDPDQVFVNGYSGGAQMSWRFACQMPTRVAAAGFVAGAAPDGCGLGHKPPLIMFHGEKDRSLPFRNTRGTLDIPALARAWAAREVCEPQESVEVLQDPDPRAEEVRWHRWSCDGQRLVEHYSFKRGGHHWPGHPRSVGSLSVDATATMWDFFQAHASSSAQKQGPGGSFGTSALVRKRADRSMLGVATGLANAVELPVKTGTGKRAVRLRLLDFINRIARQRFAGMDVRRRPQ